MARLVSLLVAVILSGQADAGSDGAPPSACRDMAFRHPVNLPQRGPSPYAIHVHQDGITNEESIEVAVQANPVLSDHRAGLPGYFTGYLLMAYNPDDEVNPIGSFSSVNSTKGQLLTCLNKRDIAVTHVNPNLKTNVTVTWTPPAGYVGPVVFEVSISESLLTYWERVPSGIIQVRPAGDTTAVSTSTTATSTSTSATSTTTSAVSTSTMATSTSTSAVSTSTTTAATTTDFACRSLAADWLITASLIMSIIVRF